MDWRSRKGKNAVLLPLLASATWLKRPLPLDRAPSLGDNHRYGCRLHATVKSIGSKGRYKPMEKHILRELAAIVAPMPVLSAPEEMLVYECDGHTLDKAPPSAVVFPSTTEQIVA